MRVQRLPPFVAVWFGFFWFARLSRALLFSALVGLSWFARLSRALLFSALVGFFASLRWSLGERGMRRHEAVSAASRRRTATGEPQGWMGPGRRDRASSEART